MLTSDTVLRSFVQQYNFAYIYVRARFPWEFSWITRHVSDHTCRFVYSTVVEIITVSTETVFEGRNSGLKSSCVVCASPFCNWKFWKEKAFSFNSATQKGCLPNTVDYTDIPFNVQLTRVMWACPPRGGKYRLRRRSQGSHLERVKILYTCTVLWHSEPSVFHCSVVVMRVRGFSGHRVPVDLCRITLV